MPESQPTAKEARAAAHGPKDIEVLRAERGLEQPDFDAHTFEYESSADLFRCVDCGVDEVTARAADGSIAPCALTGYGGDTERVYLLLTEHPALTSSRLPTLETRIRGTGIGRTLQFSWRDHKLLVETAPSVVDELARRSGEFRFYHQGQPQPVVVRIDRLTTEAARAVSDKNRAAYVDEFGEPA